MTDYAKLCEPAASSATRQAVAAGASRRRVQGGCAQVRDDPVLPPAPDLGAPMPAGARTAKPCTGWSPSSDFPLAAVLIDGRDEARRQAPWLTDFGRDPHRNAGFVLCFSQTINMQSIEKKMTRATSGHAVEAPLLNG